MRNAFDADDPFDATAEAMRTGMCDAALIDELEREVVVFLNEVRGTVAQLQRIYDPQPADDAVNLRMAG